MKLTRVIGPGRTRDQPPYTLVMKIRRANIAVFAQVAAFSLLMTGCSGTQAPTLAVTSATVRERTALGVVLDFVVVADNPNGDALPLQDVTYTVTRNGETVFTGTRSAEAVLRRYGQQEFTLPVSIALSKLPAGGEAGGEYQISGSVIYVAPGALSQTLFDQELVTPSADFSGTVRVE